MYILSSGCGWLPEAPINFISNIINLIKILTPVVLVIMGSLEFAKAVMSQKEEQIKKAQGSLIKKLIAGAAVFFVIVFAEWIMGVLKNAGATGTDNAITCLDALLNGTYKQSDKVYYDGPDVTKNTTNNNNSTTTKLTCEQCIQKFEKEINKCQEEFDDNAYELNNAGYNKAYETCTNDYENFRNAYIDYEDCQSNPNGSNTKCIPEYNKLGEFINKYGLNYDHRHLCDINDFGNCYSYEQYYNSCIEYAKQKQNSGNEESYCQQTYCKQC